MSLDVMKEVDERIEECDGLDVRREKAGLLKKVSSALEKCGDIPSLVRTLKPQGVDLVIYRDKDGIPRGSTLIDHTSPAYSRVPSCRGPSEPPSWNFRRAARHMMEKLMTGLNRQGPLRRNPSTAA